MFRGLVLKIIPSKDDVYDLCENMEQLYDNFYQPLLIEYKNMSEKYVTQLNTIRELEKSQNSVLQQENKQLEMINKEYERLNKEKGRGFKITNVQEYNIDELLSYKKYKDNWNKLKEYLTNLIPTDKTVLTKYIKIFEVLDKMQELEQGSDCGE
ncbi:MAG: hypothetical protein Q4E39_05125 [bacterium]|nr:hypothetical protein [bacterium]